MKDRPLNEQEKNLISGGLYIARDVYERYFDKKLKKLNLEDLTKTFSAWLDDESSCIEGSRDVSHKSILEKKCDSRLITSALGSAFGQFLVENLGMQWIHITDEHGQEMAVKHKEIGWINFPFSSVKKRTESKERVFFVPIAKMAEVQIKEGLAKK